MEQTTRSIGRINGIVSGTVMGTSHDSQPAVLSQVQEQISLLAKENDGLLELVGKLRSALAPVIAERGCGEEGVMSDPEASLCTLAMQIRRQRHEVEAATSILSEILYSLEL